MKDLRAMLEKDVVDRVIGVEVRRVLGEDREARRKATGSSVTADGHLQEQDANVQFEVKVPTLKGLSFRKQKRVREEAKVEETVVEEAKVDSEMTLETEGPPKKRVKKAVVKKVVEQDIESDLDAESAPSPAGLALSDIAESIPTSPHLSPTLAPAPEDTWSTLGESDIDAEAGDEREHGLMQSVQSLDLSDTEATPRAPLRLRHSHLWEHRRRSASSPSRSPARRNPPRARPRVDPPRAQPSPRSFYDYLFA